MPNAGIQAWRSTNWKSADCRVETAPEQQRLGERRARDTTSAILRTSARCRLVAAARRAAARAPAIGSATSEASRHRERSSSPEIEAENQRRRPRKRRGVRADRAGLQPAQDRAPPPTVSATPFTAPSIIPTSTTFHRPSSDTMLDRLHDGGVVDLVDVVLVREQPMDAAEGARRARRRRAGSLGRSTRRCQNAERTPIDDRQRRSATPSDTPSSSDVAGLPRRSSAQGNARSGCRRAPT